MVRSIQQVHSQYQTTALLKIIHFTLLPGQKLTETINASTNSPIGKKFSDLPFIEDIIS